MAIGGGEGFWGFCILMVIALMIDYVLQMTMFLPLVALNYERNLDQIFPCMQGEKIIAEPPVHEKDDLTGLSAIQAPKIQNQVPTARKRRISSVAHLVIPPQGETGSQKLRKGSTATLLRSNSKSSLTSAVLLMDSLPSAAVCSQIPGAKKKGSATRRASEAFITGISQAAKQEEAATDLLRAFFDGKFK